ncbi:mixed lineage kinase domain-like protein isoform X3 [Lithobates pipiens]
MEVLGQVFSVARTIYNLCDKASSNKKQCGRLKTRIRILLKTAETLEKQPDKSVALLAVVEDLVTTLENAKCWVMKYSHHAWWKQVLKSNSIKGEFELLNDCLGDAAIQISVLLAAEHKEKLDQFFKENTRKQQNAKDMEDDLKELSTSLNSHATEMKDKMDKMTAIHLACSPPKWNIIEIRVTDLKRGVLFLEQPTHYLYRGELHQSPVAIKVFKDQNVQNEEFIRKTFLSESQTMKKFECLNILRLYGICIDNSGPETCYSLVTELCEKGTLRELLQNEPDLPWNQRVLMALDTARALYRLHQTEEKAILHGNLSSFKYLVDGTYCVKLSGFELSKTETSIRRTPNVATRKKNRVLEYMAPETWQDINAYDKRSEIYSLGVVMYEIATGKPPFHCLEVTADNLVEMQEKWWASLDNDFPSSCPNMFRDLIKRLLQKNPKDRPFARVTVDLLLHYLNQQTAEQCDQDAMA